MSTQLKCMINVCIHFICVLLVFQSYTENNVLIKKRSNLAIFVVISSYVKHYNFKNNCPLTRFWHHQI